MPIVVSIASLTHDFKLDDVNFFWRLNYVTLLYLQFDIKLSLSLSNPYDKKKTPPSNGKFFKSKGSLFWNLAWARFGCCQNRQAYPPFKSPVIFGIWEYTLVLDGALLPIITVTWSTSFLTSPAGDAIRVLSCHIMGNLSGNPLLILFFTTFGMQGRSFGMFGFLLNPNQLVQPIRFIWKVAYVFFWTWKSGLLWASTSLI